MSVVLRGEVPLVKRRILTAVSETHVRVWSVGIMTGVASATERRLIKPRGGHVVGCTGAARVRRGRALSAFEAGLVWRSVGGRGAVERRYSRACEEARKVRQSGARSVGNVLRNFGEVLGKTKLWQRSDGGP